MGGGGNKFQFILVLLCDRQLDNQGSLPLNLTVKLILHRSSSV